MASSCLSADSSSAIEIELEEAGIHPAGGLLTSCTTQPRSRSSYTRTSILFHATRSRDGEEATIVQQNVDGLITVNSWRNNYFSPYSCSSCSYFLLTMRSGGDSAQYVKQRRVRRDMKIEVHETVRQ
jgi:hypothetical protein